jgi:hypothetical protein
MIFVIPQFTKKQKLSVRKIVQTLESNKIIEKNELTKFDNAINKDNMDYFEEVIENTPRDSLIHFF